MASGRATNSRSRLLYQQRCGLGRPRLLHAPCGGRGLLIL